MIKRVIPLILLAGMLMLTCMPVADAQVIKAADVNYISLIDAYYADLDADGFEDDIKLLVEFAFPIDVVARVDLNLWMELPSGYTFNIRVTVWRAPGESILNIDCLNTAIESGWYTVTLLASIMGAGTSRYYIMDEIIFDPPPAGGSGLPGVEAYF